MNLLIVDDEVYVVRALKKNIESSGLGFNQVFIAFNAAKAREILSEQEVDVMVTDIQMPMESGLDLMRWVREQGMACVAVLLTSYAEFSYAQEAMRLHVMDYVMKPINFEEIRQVLERAKDLAQTQKARQKNPEKALAWERERFQLEAHFWQSVLFSGRLSTQELIAAEAEQRGIPYDVTEQYIPVLCSVRGYGDRREDWEQRPGQMKEIIENAAVELVLSETEHGRLGWQERKLWLLAPEQGKAELREKLENLITMTSEITGADLAVYEGAPVYAEELAEAFGRLTDQDTKNVSVRRGILENERAATPRDLSLVKKIYESFDEGKIDYMEQAVRELQSESKEYIDELTLMMMVDAAKYGIQQLLRSKGKDILAFWTDDMLVKSRDIYRSVGRAEDFLIEALHRVREMLATVSDEEEMIQRIRSFVTAHLEEGVDRNKVAEYMNFNSDYLSKLFKREVGVSLGEYIIDRKVERAKLLLADSELTVSEISLRLGYNSFSYFSEVFRRKTGELPTDYRKSTRRKTE